MKQKIVVKKEYNEGYIKAQLWSDNTLLAEIPVEEFKSLLIQDIMSNEDAIKDILKKALMECLPTKDLSWSFKAATIEKTISDSMDNALSKLNPYLYSAAERAVHNVIVEKLQKATVNVA